VRIIEDVSRGEWLAARAGRWASVGGVAGTGFDAYARLLHPIGVRREDLDVTLEWGQHPVVEKTQWAWATIASRTGRTMHPLVQSRRLTNNERLMDFPDGWSLEQSREGWLDPILLAALTAHLSTTSPDDIVIAIWNGWGLPQQIQAYTSVTSASSDPDDTESERWQEEFETRQRETISAVSESFRRAVEGGPHFDYPGREFVLLQSSLRDLANPAWGMGRGIGWTTNHPEPAPQLVWPQDRAWVVASEIDWDSTIVAGTREVIDAILSDPTFEAFEVHEDDDLTWDGDEINDDRRSREQ
jgi:hypothetical protein